MRRLRPAWLRLSPRQYRLIVFVAIFFLAAIIVTGGAVRLTGSGLGCPDWPRCHGTEYVAKRSYHQVIEYGNRLFTGPVAIAVMVAALGAFIRIPRRKDLNRLAVLLGLGLLAQIVFGGLVVLFHLWPPLVMAHFLLSMAIVGDGVLLHWRASLPEPAPGASHRDGLVPLVDERIRTLGRVMVGLVATVVTLGTAVTGSGPHGGDEHVKRLPLLLPDVARVHGVFVETFSATTLLTLVLLWRRRAPRQVLRRGEVVLGVAVAQSIVGYVQYFTGVPPLLVAVHLVGAVCLWVAVLRFYLGLWEPAEAPTTAVPAEAAERPARAGAGMGVRPAQPATISSTSSP